MIPPSHSIPNIVDTFLLRGSAAGQATPADLLLEIPHGATDTSDFHELAEKLRSPLPEGLSDFFHVNTDVGAFEVALRAAELFVEQNPNRSAAVLRCRIPRTFIDCNRKIDSSPEAFKEGGVTPGLMPWVTDSADLELLHGRYQGYISAVREARESLASDGAMALLHTYSPWTVDVQVDEDIVKNLRRAYEPKVRETWPMRPEFDIISRDMEGNDHAPGPVVEELRSQLNEQNWSLANSDTYPIHPSTMAWDHIVALPGRALCLEVRRDLLADPFDPFVQMNICSKKVEPIALALAHSLRKWWQS